MTPAEQEDAGGIALRILVLDGDGPASDDLSGILAGDGMKVHACGEAVQAFRDAADFKPDLMLAALAKGQAAAELAAGLRQNEALADVPIVILAGDDDGQARFEAIAAGADDFLVIPVAPPMLIAAVRARVRRARMQGSKPASTEEPARRRGQLRRGEFLAQLGGALRNVAEPWQVLIAVSVDQSKSLVETLGHAGAFELEQRIAVRFEQVLREDDAQTLWMEFGFGILARRDSREEIEALAQEICHSVVHEPFEVRGKQLSLTLSVGVALTPPGLEPGGANRWFASAYAAQAIAHRLGGNRYEGVLTREYGNMPAERVMIIREWAKEAVAGDNILVEFQPILPLRPDLAGLYLVDTKLRDYRAPLAGVKRKEYLSLARSAGALTMIDRMSLFSAFDAIEEERAQGRMTRLLVSIDPATMNEEQLVWMDAEVRRRKAHSDGLIIELDADAVLGNPELVRLVQRLEDMGVMIAISDDSGDLVRIDRLQRLPAGLLRLPIAAVDGVSPQVFARLMTPWRGSGRGLIVGQVEGLEAVSRLLEMRIDYIQGDALAGSGPRLDYEFTQLGG